MSSDWIQIEGARLHNLKNVSVDIPKNTLVVFTGLSGSGKSTLAFDTLHKEGQRQYLESLGMVDYQGKPEVDRIRGLSPSISVGQHLTNRSPRSTVGTATEVYTYLRVLFARLGRRPCPHCGVELPPAHQVEGAFEWESEGGEMETAEVEAESAAGAFGSEYADTFPCPACGRPVPDLGMGNFSFNKPAGACPVCTGLGVVQTARVEKLIDEAKSLEAGAVYGWDIHTIRRNRGSLEAAARHFGFAFDLDQPVRSYTPAQRDLLLYGADQPQFLRHFPGVKPPDARHRGLFEGVVTNLLRRYADHIHDVEYRQKMGEFLHSAACPACAGTRLRPEALQVRVDGLNIIEASRLPLGALADWLRGLAGQVAGADQYISQPIFTDLEERIRRLVNVGVEYLTLDRTSPSLSGGEAQRLRLASLLGSGLTGVLYVLDEPTIGLHPRDTARLINILRQLRVLGNTVLVIEHDPDMLRAADYLVDIGPGAGKHGGQVVAAGAPGEVAANPASVTGAYLAGRLAAPIPAQRRAGNGASLRIEGARQHNLKNLTVAIPLGCLVAVTGVSGSGKSSLIFDILDRAARQRFNHSEEAPGDHDAIRGWEHLDKVITVDQSGLGRIPRSNAATYTDAFTPIRETFAAAPEARRRGLEPRHFSFNVPGGRCERCQGAGFLNVHMHFLPDAQVRCPACKGRRFTKNVLAVQYRGYDIAQVLNSTIEEALELFAGVPAVAERLGLLAEVGLGYLQLGQPTSTLSGGEAQRVKLAKELSRRGTGRTLYLLDEPTTGLHMADTARLLILLQKLVTAGNSVLVVEHNLDLIRAADWVIDLGPEGGQAGGYLVAEGAPEQIAAVEQSYTGRHLRAG